MLRGRALSYRHLDHAGNFADLHKHWLLDALLAQLFTTAEPLHYLESHAGAGRYRRRQGVRDNFVSGIARIWRRPLSAPTVKRLRSLIEAENPDGMLQHYLGSPLIAARRLRPCDRATLAERHRATLTELAHTLDADRRFALLHGDGPQLVSRRLPSDGRLLLLVDPPFTAPAEFAHIATWLARLWQQRPDGIVALWYPLCAAAHHHAMLKRLSQAIAVPTLDSELRLSQRDRGMFGSGMRLFNPPAGLHRELQRDAPELARLLGAEETFRYWEA